MLGGIAFQLCKYTVSLLEQDFTNILTHFEMQLSLLCTRSALESFSYDTCGSYPSVLLNLMMIRNRKRTRAQEEK